jgi:hypothetical protein
MLNGRGIPRSFMYEQFNTLSLPFCLGTVRTRYK